MYAGSSCTEWRTEEGGEARAGDCGSALGYGSCSDEYADCDGADWYGKAAVEDEARSANGFDARSSSSAGPP